MKNIDPKCKCKGCSFLLKLEAERFDQSYKNHAPKPKDEITARDKMFFDAGRYVAGMRDRIAKAADAELQLFYQKLHS